MSFNCDICGNNLKNQNTLDYHKKNNKKCLQIQLNEKDSSSETEQQLLSCEFCKNTFSLYNLRKHLKVCKIKKHEEYENNLKIQIQSEFEEKLKEKIQFVEKEKNDLSNKISLLEKEKNDFSNKISLLENELKIYKNLYEEKNNVVVDLAKEPKNKTNHNNNKINVNNNNSYFNYFDEPDKMKEIISKNLTIEHIIDGQKGVAEFAQQYLLTDKDGDPNYFCSDVSRNSFKYKTKNGDLEKDNKAVKLTKLMINNGLKNTTIQKASQIWTNEDGSQDSDKYHLHSESAQEIVNLGEDNTKFRNHLASIIAK
jgi:hypothetical protein